MVDSPVPSQAPSVRARLGALRARVLGTSTLYARTSRQAGDLTRLRQRAEELEKRLAAHAAAADKQAARLKDLEGRLKTLDRASALTTAERERRDAQLGSVEHRLGDVEEQLADGRLLLGGSSAGATPDGTPDAASVDPEDLTADQARALLREVREEHARVRVRMQVVSGYEERLRRVEESLAELYDGDPRHLV